MDIGAVASASSALASSKTGDAVGIAMLKKALDIEAQNAAQLIEALPQQYNNPPNVGQSVDTFV